MVKKLRKISLKGAGKRISAKGILRSAVSRLKRRKSGTHRLVLGGFVERGPQTIQVNVPQQPMQFQLSREAAPEEDDGWSGVSLPSSLKKITTSEVSTDWKEKTKSNIEESYPIVSMGSSVVNVRIHWDAAEQSLVYDVLEPRLSPEEEDLLRKIEEKLEEKLDLDFAAATGVSQENYLRENFRKIIDLFGIRLTPDQVSRFEYFVFRNFVGLNEIEPMMHDSQIEDISCDGVGIPVYIVHRNPKYHELKTNIVFKTKKDLDSFVIKLSQRCGRAISVATPLLDGVLPDGSRVQTTLGSDIARRGSNFTIRKFSEHPFTPCDLIDFGTLDAMSLAFLWLMIENGKSILIAGSTATGKTTILNSLALFIRPELKIVSIEDTGELQLPNPNWIPEVSRAGTGVSGYGAVEMFDLLKAALRQRPDYIIVGEVRGKEANVMFQGMATGHPAMGTIHADDVQKVVDRLITAPISLSPALLENLDLIVFIIRTKKEGRYIRRMNQLVEVRKVDVKEGRLKPNIVFQWDPISDTLKPKDPSVLLEKICKFRGIKQESILEELNRRAALIVWLQKKHVTDYKLFAYYVSKYYSTPQDTMAMVQRDLKYDIKAAVAGG